jgi:hypothetical protein
MIAGHLSKRLGVGPAKTQILLVVKSYFGATAQRHRHGHGAATSLTIELSEADRELAEIETVIRTPRQLCAAVMSVPR